MKRSYGGSLRSFNDRMHIDNPFLNRPPDFKDLASKYPEFNSIAFVNKRTGQLYLDWSDPKSLLELNKAIMKEEFGLEWSMPDAHLCPGIPGRMNYIVWIHELLELVMTTTCPSIISQPEKNVMGIDIGTGASLIYPLLGNKQYGWHFLATDIDEASLENCKDLIRRNSLEDSIQVIHKTVGMPILSDIVSADPGLPIAFCMCNPPFFEDDTVMHPNPHTECTGSTNEMITSGGELAMIDRIISESMELQQKVILYTTLLGRRKDMHRLVARLKSNNISRNVASTVLYQGNTLRWAVAWSFYDEFGDAMSKCPEKYSVKLQEKMSSRKNDVEFTCDCSVHEVFTRLKQFCLCLHGGLEIVSNIEYSSENGEMSCVTVNSNCFSIDYSFKPTPSNESDLEHMESDGHPSLPMDDDTKPLLFSAIIQILDESVCESMDEEVSNEMDDGVENGNTRKRSYKQMSEATTTMTTTTMTMNTTTMNTLTATAAHSDNMNLVHSHKSTRLHISLNENPKDRAAFFKFTDLLKADVLRTNRRWKRIASNHKEDIEK